MPDPIYKLQPHRTIHLKGFSDFGAAGAIHHASDTGFTASGAFRDAANFCVIRLWDRDDFFGYPRFSCPTLTSPPSSSPSTSPTKTSSPFDSPKFSTIDWPYLNCRTTAGALIQIPLFANATQVAGDYLAAARSRWSMPAFSPSTASRCGIRTWRSTTSCPTRPPASPPRASSPTSVTRSTPPTGPRWAC